MVLAENLGFDKNARLTEIVWAFFTVVESLGHLQIFLIARVAFWPADIAEYFSFIYFHLVPH